MKHKKLFENIDKDRWNKCGSNLDINNFKGLSCYAAIDIDSTDDFAALSIVFPIKKNNIIEYYGFCHCWLLERSLNDNPKYKLWHKHKLLKIIKEDVLDYKVIVDWLMILNSKFDIKKVALDRWGSSQLSHNLESNGFTVILFGQGYRFMTRATKGLFNLLGIGRFHHDDNPILNRMANSLIIIENSAHYIKPDKSSSKENIGGIVAMIMALGISMKHFIIKKEEPNPILEDIKELKNGERTSLYHETDSICISINELANGFTMEYYIKPIYFKNPDNLLKLINTSFKDIDNINKKIEEILNEI